MQGAGFSGVGCKGVWGAHVGGCGVWGVGCGVWGVGCGVWGAQVRLVALPVPLIGPPRPVLVVRVNHVLPSDKPIFSISGNGREFSGSLTMLNSNFIPEIAEQKFHS